MFPINKQRERQSGWQRKMDCIFLLLTGRLLAHFSGFIFVTPMPWSGKLFPESSQLFQLVPEQEASRSKLVLYHMYNHGKRLEGQ